MKVFYTCYGSAHSSVVAAAIHLGYLPKERVPPATEFLHLPYYDRNPSKVIGTPFFMGADPQGNEVYIMGLGAEKALIRRIVKNFLEICGYPASQVLFVDALNGIPLITKIGGILSRSLGWVAFGRRLTIYGLQKHYFHLVSLVECTQEYLRKA